LEIRAAIYKGQNYFTFDACLKAGVKAETALCINAEYNKAFKSVPKDKAPDKAKKGKSKAHNDLVEGRSVQGALQHLCGIFHS
jgi:hypothetical protein